MSWDRHRRWSWRGPAGFTFAGGLRTVPVILAEAAAAASCFPLVFVAGPAGPMPHALLRRGGRGLSVFVGPAGQWQAAWLPPRLRAWPFDLVPADGGHALALHETSDLVTDGPGGLPVFAAGDTPALAPEAARIAALLETQAAGLPATARAAAALSDGGLLRVLDPGAGLMTVNPAAVAALDEGGVLALHRAGALGLVHAAVVSCAHLDWMEKAEARQAAASLAPARPAADRPRAGSGFLAALAAAVSADEAPVRLPGRAGP